MTLEHLIINNKYRLISKVGSGSYGVVYKAQHINSGKTYAIKIILKKPITKATTTPAEVEQLQENNKALIIEMEHKLRAVALETRGNLAANLLNMSLIEQFGRRCKILKEISLQLKVHKHPNVLSIYKVYDSDAALFIVMDYYPEGDLFQTIVDVQRYAADPNLVKSVFIQLVDVINYCHSKGIYHCDLKPENILVAENGTKVVLADFGLAIEEDYIASDVCCGSSYYMAPERLTNFSYCFGKPNETVRFPTASGDIWSLCIILINLISIRNPWLKASVADPTFKAFVHDPNVLLRILPISNQIASILHNYLRVNPWERKSLFELRCDIVACPQLAQKGPLSVCPVYSDALNDVCMVPVDHVADQRRKSQEYCEKEEQETAIVPPAGHVDISSLVHSTDPTQKVARCPFRPKQAEEKPELFSPFTETSVSIGETFSKCMSIVRSVGSNVTFDHGLKWKGYY